MSVIPDFVLQVQEVETDFMAEWQSVRANWKDAVAEGFDQGVIEPYTKNFHQYLTGEGITGYGLPQLLQQMSRHQQEMELLTIE